MVNTLLTYQLKYISCSAKVCKQRDPLINLKQKSQKLTSASRGNMNIRSKDILMILILFLVGPATGEGKDLFPRFIS